MDGESNQRDEVREDALAAGPFDLRFLQRRIRLPELGFIPEVRRLFDRVGQFLDVFKGELLARLRHSVTRRYRVENLQGGDLVLVLGDELLERLHDGAGAGQGIGAEACLDDLVLAHMVDGEFVLLLDVDEEFPELRVLEWPRSLLKNRGRCLLNLLLGRLVRAELLPRPLFLPIGIDRFDQSAAQVLERVTATRFHNRLVVCFRDAVLHAGEAAGDAGEHVFVGVS